MCDEVITIYCRIDDKNRITDVNSSIFLTDTTTWMELDNSDSGSRPNNDAYVHAQGNYFPNPLIDDTGAHRYIYDESFSPKYRETTFEEMKAERDSFIHTANTPTEMEKLRADLDYVMLMSGLDVDPK